MENDINIMSIITIVGNLNGCSIREINKITNIKPSILKYNMEYISQNPNMYFNFRLKAKEKYDDSNYLDVKWYIENNENDYLLLSLTSLEKHLLELMAGKIEYQYLLDSNNYESIQQHRKKIIMLERAMIENEELNIQYICDDKIEEKIIKPVGAFFVDKEKEIYIVSKEDNKKIFYRLSKLLLFEKEEYDFYYTSGLENKYEKLTKVKIKFINKEGVRFDVEKHKSIKKDSIIDKHDNYFLYSDKVVLDDEFKKWIKTFGANAVVLEPVELRNEIIEWARVAYKSVS